MNAHPFLLRCVLLSIVTTTAACGGAVSLGEIGPAESQPISPEPGGTSSGTSTTTDGGVGAPGDLPPPIDPDACGEPEDATPRDVALATPITEGSFALDDAAGPSGSLCDIHTALLLRKGPACAKLEEVVNGVCEVVVDPDRRSYLLRRVGMDCGSAIYEGRVLRASGERTVRVTDHRARVCADVVPSKIVVEETISAPTGPRTVTRYAR